MVSGEEDNNTEYVGRRATRSPTSRAGTAVAEEAISPASKRKPKSKMPGKQAKAAKKVKNEVAVLGRKV